MTVPFGKHRGEDVSALPDDYLRWLSSLPLHEPLRAAVDAEVERRRGPLPDARVTEDLIAAGQRALARRAHPDRGGTHEQMLRVRLAADWLYEKTKSLRELRP